jgi:small subunit ribosomal protein S15
MRATELIDVSKYRIHENDTGSVELQVYLLTAKIYNLTLHLKNNKKDVSSRYGMNNLLSRRRRFLKYLARSAPEQYTKITKDIDHIEAIYE